MPLQSQAVYDEFMAGLRELIAPYAGKVEYGNLRSQASDWDTGEGPRITNVAIVYETPGGSTDQINVSFDHALGICGVDPQMMVVAVRHRYNAEFMSAIAGAHGVRLFHADPRRVQLRRSQGQLKETGKGAPIMTITLPMPPLPSATQIPYESNWD